jgi:hypothetical protein
MAVLMPSAACMTEDATGSAMSGWMPEQQEQIAKKKRKISVLGKVISLPASRIGRIALGSGLIVGGVLGFLPVGGFWMLPLGVIVLAQDIGPVRRFRRRLVVRFSKRNEKHRG